MQSTATFANQKQLLKTRSNFANQKQLLPTRSNFCKLEATLPTRSNFCQLEATFANWKQLLTTSNNSICSRLGNQQHLYYSRLGFQQYPIANMAILQIFLRNVILIHLRQIYTYIHIYIYIHIHINCLSSKLNIICITLPCTSPTLPIQYKQTTITSVCVEYISVYTQQ